MKAILMLLGIVALVLFIWGCAAVVTGAHNGIQQYNQQNPSCTLDNPDWPDC